MSLPLKIYLKQSKFDLATIQKYH